jgi:hypothetical protein
LLLRLVEPRSVGRRFDAFARWNNFFCGGEAFRNNQVCKFTFCSARPAAARRSAA